MMSRVTSDVSMIVAAEQEPSSNASPTRDGARRGKLRFRSLACGLALLAVFCALGARGWRRFGFDRELALARQSLREFRPDDAVERLNRLIALRPDWAEAHFLLASAYRRAGRLDQVEPHLRRAADLGWDEREIDRQFCLSFFQAGDFSRSQAELADRIQRQASDDEAEELYEALARGYMAAMLLPEATFVLDGWLRWRPGSAPAHLLAAQISVLAGNDDRELECYQAAVNADPANFEARRHLALALLPRNELDQAADLLRGCLDERPEAADVLIGLAECQQRRGEMEEAKRLLQSALESAPGGRQQATALMLFGEMALAQKDYAEACRCFQRAFEAQPSNANAAYSLAQALARAGRGAEAKPYLARLERLQALDDALHDLRIQLLEQPDDPDLRAQIGETLLEQGSTQAGVNWLFSALIHDRSHLRANRLLADYYDREGRHEQARRHRELAAREAPSLAPLIPLRPEADEPPRDRKPSDDEGW